VATASDPANATSIKGFQLSGVATASAPANAQSNSGFTFGQTATGKVYITAGSTQGFQLGGTATALMGAVTAQSVSGFLFGGGGALSVSNLTTAAATGSFRLDQSALASVDLRATATGSFLFGQTVTLSVPINAQGDSGFRIGGAATGKVFVNAASSKGFQLGGVATAHVVPVLHLSSISSFSINQIFAGLVPLIGQKVIIPVRAHANPAIAVPTQQPKSLQTTAEQLKESVEILQGVRGTTMVDAAVRWSDLIDLALILREQMPDRPGGGPKKR
jgi:hypothetical protein